MDEEEEREAKLYPHGYDTYKMRGAMGKDWGSNVAQQINTTVRMLTPQVVAAGCQSAPGLLSSTSIHGASERRATIAFD